MKNEAVKEEHSGSELRSLIEKYRLMTLDSRSNREVNMACKRCMFKPFDVLRDPTRLNRDCVVVPKKDLEDEIDFQEGMYKNLLALDRKDKRKRNITLMKAVTIDNLRKLLNGNLLSKKQDKPKILEPWYKHPKGLITERDCDGRLLGQNASNETVVVPEKKVKKK